MTRDELIKIIETSEERIACLKIGAECRGDCRGCAERMLDDYDAQVKADAMAEYNWISVKDKMPEDCGQDWVLVLPYDRDYRCIPTVAEYRRGHWYGHALFTEDERIDGENNPFEVRFWKPIYDEFLLKFLEQLKEQKNG